MKRIVLFILIASASTSSFSQSEFGLKLGANYSNLKFSNKSYTTSSVLGIHVGGFYNYKLGNKTGLQGEVFLSTEGNKWKTTNTTGKVKEIQVRIPILLQYTLPKNIYAEAGPQYSLLVSIKQRVNDGPNNNIKEFYKAGTVGFALGAGYCFKERRAGLRAGIRYNSDFSKINKANVGGNDLKNSLLQLSFMYAIASKKVKK